MLEPAFLDTATGDEVPLSQCNPRLLMDIVNMNGIIFTPTENGHDESFARQYAARLLRELS